MGHQPELQIEQRKLLDLHLELVLKENERSNLTRIVDWQQGQLLHIEDSLVGLQEFEDAPSGRAADLGFSSTAFRHKENQFASFQLLAHFQPGFLKLDSAFTADPSLAKEQLEKTQEITSKAQSAGILTIAEFVADASTMSLLFSAGVDYVEGDFVGQPTAEMDFEFG